MIDKASILSMFDSHIIGEQLSLLWVKILVQTIAIKQDKFERFIEESVVDTLG